MKLSEQEESVLDYIQNIEVVETLNLWEAGSAFFKTVALIGDSKILMENPAELIKIKNS
ncbi:hypothetical protein LUD75_18525 [Epilithonimonas sp. JDS]|uniref:hypothetical protein n=1 Tax=Epilithonimonas sp. JDS TaxID=2902797 RepID=UPI001E4BF327|nr:hypothetical protein [Epilithonimonas sp. JDS]MCD9856726.1 hypothetical protein [Epilithonimonas sp. JDS]